MLGIRRVSICSFNAARSIMCIGTANLRFHIQTMMFQCRTRHYMCWNRYRDDSNGISTQVSMPHAALCVLGRGSFSLLGKPETGFNAARSMMCVGTLSSPAIVPRGLRRCFGKSSVFRAVFAVKMRFSDERSHGRWSLFLVRRGLCRFGKTQRRNVVCASLWIIFHFASITK